MDKKSPLRWIISIICIGTVVLPPRIQSAAEPTGLITIRDVALNTDGSLRGTLMTAAGKPQPHADVLLRKGKETVGVVKTEADGSFAIRPVRPGLYELSSARSAHLYRVWNARSAPPAAQPSALLIQENVIVRGQEEWSPARRALILGGIIVTSGVIGGVIGYSIKDDESAS